MAGKTATADLRTTAVIVAAGSSSRMGGRVRKPFLKVAGRPVLALTLANLARVRSIRAFVLVVRPEDEAAARRVCAGIERELAGRPVSFAHGGPRRQDSVLNGLRTCDPALPLVAIHDAARPFAAPGDIELALVAAAKVGGAILACPVRDTIKVVEDGGRIRKTVPRDRLYAAQTPQCFRFAEFLRVTERACAEDLAVTDDAAIFEAYRRRVVVIESGPENLKITTPWDLKVARLCVLETCRSRVQ